MSAERRYALTNVFRKRRLPHDTRRKEIENLRQISSLYEWIGVAVEQCPRARLASIEHCRTQNPRPSLRVTFKPDHVSLDHDETHHVIATHDGVRNLERRRRVVKHRGYCALVFTQLTPIKERTAERTEDRRVT